MEKQEGEVVLIMEEQVDEDETLLLRKSRIVAADGSENKCTDVELSNGTESHKSNGHEIVNGDNNKFQDEAEARTENLVVYDKDEGNRIVFCFSRFALFNCYIELSILNL